MQWKDELGTRLPRTRRGAKGLRTYRAITFEEATPYECADPATGVTDYVSLCLHLVKISYPPLDALLESEDFLDVISVSARIEPKSVNTSSLLWVTGMVFRTHVRQSGRDENFRQLVIDAAPTLKRGHGVLKNLEKGRPTGAQAKKDSAIAIHQQWRKAAIDYLKANPTKTLDNAAHYIHRNANLNQDGKAIRTIRDVIKGCDKEARQQLSKPRL